MENTETKDLLHRILSIPIGKFLETLDLRPVTEIGDRLIVYHSTAFGNPIVLNPRQNTWGHGHEMIQQRTLLDFITKHWDCKIPDAIDKLKDHPLLPKQALNNPLYPKPEYTPLVDVRTTGATIDKGSIANYFKEREIPLEFANEYCAGYWINIAPEKLLYPALALKDQAEVNHLMVVMSHATGSEQTFKHRPFEVWNESDFTFKDRGSKILDVYASIPDLLHHQYMYYQNGIKDTNLLLLSDVFAFEKARTVMESHQKVNLLLPNDLQENLYKGYAQWLSPKYHDQSTSYSSSYSYGDSKLKELELKKQSLDPNLKKQSRGKRPPKV